MSIATTLPTANGHFIDLTTAIEMTTAYRADREAMLDFPYRNNKTLPLSETFNRADIDVLLAQPACEGLRIYFGNDEHARMHAILVAVNENNEDILPSLTASLNPEEDIILELSQRCPDMCPPESPLNS